MGMTCDMDVIGILWGQEKKDRLMSLEHIKKAVGDRHDSYDCCRWIPKDSPKMLWKAELSWQMAEAALPRIIEHIDFLNGIFPKYAWTHK